VSVECENGVSKRRLFDDWRFMIIGSVPFAVRCVAAVRGKVAGTATYRRGVAMKGVNAASQCLHEGSLILYVLFLGPRYLYFNWIIYVYLSFYIFLS
jgi:hypothetical protein